MATLVLTAVGTVIGGPIGGAIGSLIGQSIDRNLLFRPAAREGPRLTDLAVQTSSYGAAIPRLYGTMRVAGTVIWSTDLIETRNTSSNGKGQPKTISYSYSASFAVLLSARAIRGVGRIWADGKLLRGAAGDFKSGVGGFRVWTGEPEQAADPAIASVEGIGRLPAYRGMAYVVFEQLQLADFGNRIPSLTFEVTADPGEVSVGAILSDMTQGVIAPEEVGKGEAIPLLGGYSAYGGRQAALAGDLADIAGGWFAPGDDTVILRSGTGAGTVIQDEGVRVAGERKGVSGRSIEAPDRAPFALTLSYYDPARDYQAGLQRAWRPGAGARTEPVELPAAITADGAQALAAALLTRRDLERQTRTLAADWRALSLLPGDRVSVEGEGGTWRLTAWSLEGMRVTMDLKRIAPAGPLMTGAESGRAQTAPDAVAGATRLEGFELPSLDDTLLSRPRILIAANGTAPDWRSAVLSYAVANAGGGVAAGSVSISSILGRVATALPFAGSALVDQVNTVDVDLLRDDMMLSDADQAALDAGANAALVGSELIQFARAKPMGGGRWRLSGLWRGRRGTEWAAAAHQTGERFVLIDSAALVVLDLPLSNLGSAITVEGSGVGDGDGPAMAVVDVTGDSVIPPAPTGLTVEWPSPGRLRLSWVRRSRQGWAWRDGGDVPLGEEGESYRVTVTDAAGLAQVIETEAPLAELTLAGAETFPLSAAIRQRGTLGLSRALYETINPEEESA